MSEIFQSLTQLGVRTISFSTPLIIATLGEIINEKSGNLNLGVEGMMSVGAIAGFAVGFHTGNPYLGMLVAVLAGALFSQLHAVATIQFRAHQTVSGLALTLAGTGLANVIGRTYTGRPLPEGAGMERLDLSFLEEIPIVSQLAKIFLERDLIFYIGIAAAIIVWVIFKRTKWGINLRSVGENPKAAESQGISVAWYRHIAILVGGAFAGLAGSFVTLVYNTSWHEDPIQGRGWIAVALTIFARWNPLGAIWGSLIFGLIFVLQFFLQPYMDPSLLEAMPYMTTLVVLVIGGMDEKRRRSGVPAALGTNFYRGER